VDSESNGFNASNAAEGPPPGLGRRLLRLFRELLETVLPAILIALLINVFVGQATRVEGLSMEPNLHSEQRLVVEKVSYRFSGPQRYDIVVLKLPSQGDELLIKRVVGLPGETVEIRDGGVFINGEALDEPYISDETRPGRNDHITVPPLHVYVLGDNRNHSNDSRSFGPVPIENVVGRAWISYWPPEELGLIR
jgi:signal peptidase I